MAKGSSGKSGSNNSSGSAPSGFVTASAPPPINNMGELETYRSSTMRKLASDAGYTAQDKPPAEFMADVRSANGLYEQARILSGQPSMYRDNRDIKSALNAAADAYASLKLKRK